MKMFRILSAAALLISATATAGFEYPAVSARQLALSGSYVGGASHDAFMLNPALSPFNTQLYAGLSFSRLYNLAEMQYASGVIAKSFKNHWGGGLAVESFGGKLYSETKLTLNLARRFLDERLSFGISAHYFMLTVQNYESAATAGISVGMHYAINENWSVGSSLENLNQPKLNHYSEEMPQAMRIGVRYLPAEAIQAYVTVEKDRWYEPQMSFGVVYQLSQMFSFYSGYTTQTNKPSGGLSLQTNRVVFSYALQYHFDLGETHFFSIALGN
jgi:outer membrane protein assembly factor BamA